MSYKDILNSLSDDANLRALTPDEIARLKKVLLDNYLFIQDFCHQNNLTIMLSGGSALGAVRHKGFIPWDDDFDTAMPRKDYDTFKELLEQQLGDRYVLDAPNTSRKSTNRFPRILIKNTRLVELGMADDDENACVKIDLFVIENTPRNRLVRTLHGLLCTALMFIAGHVGSYEEQSERFKAYMCKTAEGKKTYYRRIRIGRVFSFLPAYKWFNIVDKVCQWKRQGDYMNIPTGRKHYFGEMLPSKAFLPVSQGVFEGHPVNLPGDIEAYLTNMFGDYMAIPKEEDREKHFIYDISFGD